MKEVIIINEIEDINMGDTIKKLRNNLKLSLRDVAAMSGLSTSTLSQIENNKINPTILTLKKIANSLNVSVIALLTISENSNIIFTKKNERLRIIRNKSNTKEIVEEFLIDSFDLTMEPAIILMPKGSDSLEHISHDGEEFITVLKGAVEVGLLEVDKYILYEGDTLYYPCTIPHIFKNVFDGESEFLIVATPSSF